MLMKAILGGVLIASVSTCGPGSGGDGGSSGSAELKNECIQLCGLEGSCGAGEMSEAGYAACQKECDTTIPRQADDMGEECGVAYTELVQCISALDCDPYAEWKSQEADFVCRPETVHIEAECPGLLDSLING